MATSIEPDPAARGTYDQLYGSFLELYPATKDVVHTLAARAREV